MNEPAAPSESPALRRVLKPVHIWAIAVGLVISGEYFGWNYGWAVGGTIGLLIATIIVTILYITFIFSFTELTTAIPHAGGPFAYALAAFGPWGGLAAGYATLIEFVITPPAIAFALGSYTNFLYPFISVQHAAIGSFVIFTGINLLGIKESANFSLILTLLAVAELLLYLGIVMPSFQIANFTRNGMPFGWQGVFAALPFAIWFYLAIEGVAMVSEEVKDPERNIRKGYLYGLGTLIVLALSVMIFTGGLTDWRQFSEIDYPLPAAIAFVMGNQNPLTRIFASIGLFGLVASFHGTIIGCSRQIFALAREGYLPSFLARVNQRFRTPHWALAAGSIAGCAALLLGTTDQVIVLAALGAVVMYMISLIALFQLRLTKPDMPRPFKVPFYPVVPIIALGLCFVCLVSIICYNLLLSVWFFAGFLGCVVIFTISRSGLLK